MEDFYDVPPKRIRLLGGWHDGEVITIPSPEWPARWRMPGRPPDLTAMLQELDPAVPTAHVQYPTYDRTDSIDDHGIRAYTYIGDGR